MMMARSFVDLIFVLGIIVIMALLVSVRMWLASLGILVMFGLCQL